MDLNIYFIGYLEHVELLEFLKYLVLKAKYQILILML